MTQTTIVPMPLPATRILGNVTGERRQLLAYIDVIVGYVTARHRVMLAGWRLEAALVEDRPGFRGGETIAIRAMAVDGRSPSDLPPVPIGVLREIGSRITSSFTGIANVVPDVSAPAPDVDGLHMSIDDREPWIDDAQTA